MLAARDMSQDGKHQHLSEGIWSEYVSHGCRGPDLDHVTGQEQYILGRARPALLSHDAGTLVLSGATIRPGSIEGRV